MNNYTKLLYILWLSLYSCIVEKNDYCFKQLQINESLYMGIKNQIETESGCIYQIGFTDTLGTGNGRIKIKNHTFLVNLINSKDDFDTLLTLKDTIGTERKIEVQTSSFDKEPNKKGIITTELIYIDESSQTLGIRVEKVLKFPDQSGNLYDIVVFMSLNYGTIGNYITPSSNDNPWELILSERGDILKDEIDYSKSKFGKLQ